MEDLGRKSSSKSKNKKNKTPPSTNSQQSSKRLKTAKSSEPNPNPSDSSDKSKRSKPAQTEETTPVVPISKRRKKEGSSASASKSETPIKEPSHPEKTEKMSDKKPSAKKSTPTEKKELNKSTEKSPSLFGEAEAPLPNLNPFGRRGEGFAPSPSLSRGRLTNLLNGMKSDNEVLQLQCLMELCDFLSIGTEDSMASFQVDLFVPPLVNLLNAEHNPEMMLLACRSLAYLMEALPSAASSVVSHEAVPSLCARLLNIEYIDVAEQAIQCLEKISYEHFPSLLRAGALGAVLMFLDFFPIGTQRSAVNIAANICRQVPVDSFELVVDAIPTLTNLLSNSDTKVMEKAIIAVARLADSFFGNEDKLQRLTKNGLLSQLVKLLSTHGTGSISSGTYTLVVRLLTTLSSCCPSLALPLLQENITSILVGIIAGSNTDASNNVSSVTTEQLYEILSLINEMMPPLPKDVNQFFVMGPKPLLNQQLQAFRKGRKDPTLENILKKREERREEEYSSESEEEHEALTPRETSTSTSKVEEEKKDPRVQILNDHPKLLVSLGENLLNPLVQVFSSTVNLSVRYKILSAITKILHFSTSTMLKDLLRNLSVSSFTAGLLASADFATVAIAVVISEILLGKLPEIFKLYFKREGVVFELDRLSKLDVKDNKKTETNSNTKSETMSIVDLQNWIKEHSKKLKNSFFQSKMEDDDSEQLKHLKSVAQKLQSCIQPESISPQDSEVLIELSKILSAEDGVSTFEFLRSSLLDSLLSFLTSRTNSALGTKTVLERVSNFCKIFLSPESTEKSEKTQPALVLVRKLNQALNKMERFPVILNEIGGTAAGLKYLTQPFKLKLTRVSEDSRLVDYSENLVLVEPLATVTAIHDFLVGKVKADPSKTTTPSKSPKSEEKKETKEPVKRETRASAKQKYQSPPKEVEETKTTPSSKKKAKRKQRREKAKEKSKAEPMETEKEPKDPMEEEVEEPLEDLSEDDEEIAPRTPEVFDVQLSPDNNATEPPPPKPNVLKLNLYFEGELLPPTSSLFQSIQRISRKQEMSSSDGAQPLPVHTLWDKTHTITYSVAETNEESTGSGNSSIDGRGGYVPPLESPYLNFINAKNADVEAADSTKNILSLLRILNELNNTWSSHVPVLDRKVSHKHIISPTEFINSKLTAKIMRQLQDPLTLCSGALPEWCKLLVYNYSYLFPFECRRLYFFCTSFGIARALHALQQHLSGNSAPTTSRNSEFRVGRIQRQKVRIARNRLLDSMLKVMELYGKSKAVLEVEYFGEVGTGLGPTLEFYTLASRDLQRKDLHLWRDEKPLKEPAHGKDGKTEETSHADDSSISPEHKFVFNTGGLFPTLIKPGDDSESTKKIMGIFKSMGTFIAKAMLDSRLLDMHFSRAFLKWMLSRSLNFDDLKDIDADFGNSMEKIANVCRQKQSIGLNASLSQDDKKKRTEGLKLGECSISDLNLDFTMPGRPQWELKANGKDTDVTINNLEEYLNLIVQQYLITGVSAQLEAFKTGFNSVFPLENLGLFNSEELETLLCGAEQASWDMQTLLENTRCDHGYTHDSQSVKYLLEIMTELSPKEQRQFLLFVTGSPNLPPGGFKSLDPKLTIVRKEADGKDPDTYLPSVNCCFYYLKLPEYSSKKLLKDKLMFAIENGQGSFSFN